MGKPLVAKPGAFFSFEGDLHQVLENHSVSHTVINLRTGDKNLWAFEVVSTLVYEHIKETCKMDDMWKDAINGEEASDG